MKTGLSIPGKSIITGLMRVDMTLRNVLYISYAVSEGSLRAFVPDFMRLATLEKDVAFLSIVVLRSTKVRISSFPFAHFNYNQLNLRTYIIDPDTGKHGVYFLKSGVTSRFISLATRTVGIPWKHIDLELQVTPGDNSLRYSYNAAGNWQEYFHITAVEAPQPLNKLKLFADVESAVEYIVRPLIGFFGESGHIGRFTIWHEDVMPQIWQLQQLNFPLLDELDIIKEVENPHSVFFLPQADFYIYMPPTFVKRKGG
jgi:hypothetical protein